MERNLYVSPLLEGKEDWAKLIPKSDGHILKFYEPDEASQFFFSNLWSPEMKPKVDVLPLYNEHKKKVVNQMGSAERFEMADNFLTEQLEMENARKRKKEKKIDFI